MFYWVFPTLRKPNSVEASMMDRTARGHTVLPLPQHGFSSGLIVKPILSESRARSCVIVDDRENSGGRMPSRFAMVLTAEVGGGKPEEANGASETRSTSASADLLLKRSTLINISGRLTSGA